VADRIAGAIVDLAYAKERDPKVAVEVLIGHGKCHVIVETGTELNKEDIEKAIYRIAGNITPDVVVVKQDQHLAANQSGKIRCGDNGIFKGVPVTPEQIKLSAVAKLLYSHYPTDGKYILDRDKLIICQSNATEEELRKEYPTATINPLGYWTGGPDVDSGATNRKLGSDMADSATGGGINGKDCSKADVSVNIYAFLKAQETGQTVWLSCAIGDEYVDGRPYEEIVEIAKDYIKKCGGFEKFSEWGLV
jgi:S-adenosylmethionine synthetase